MIPTISSVKATRTRVGLARPALIERPRSKSAGEEHQLLDHDIAVCM
jgi:hypothetical protein